MINMFSHMACICHFVFYALPRTSYGYIWCGFIPRVVWRFSNIFFLLFIGRHVYILGGVSGHPHVCMPHTFICPHTFIHPRGVHTPICPHTLLCLCVFWRLCMLWGVVMGSLCVGTPSLHHPCYGGASP